MSLSSAYEPRP